MSTNVEIVYPGPPGPVGPAGPQGPISLFISDTPPANPQQGLLWWDSNSAILFVWYVEADGSSQQWVQVNTPGPPGAAMLSGEGAPAAGLGSDGDSYFDTTTGDIYVKTDGTWTITGNIYNTTPAEVEADADRAEAAAAAAAEAAAAAIEIVSGKPFDITAWFTAKGYGGAYYDISNLQGVFTDMAGTVPATAVGNEVRYIADLSGHAHHLTSHDTLKPGILVKLRDKWAVRLTNQAAFKTPNNKPLQMPTYVAIATNLTYAGDASLFGPIRSATSLSVVRNHNIQNRVKVWQNATGLGITNLTSYYDQAPLYAPLVADAQMTIGTQDIAVNGIGRQSQANNWTGTPIGNDAVYGLNMSSSTIANPTTMQFDFMGGVIAHAVISEADRASIVAYFKSRVQRAPVITDRNILVIGDSTGDGHLGSTGDKEWPYFLALNTLAAADPTAYVGMKLYEEAFFAYSAEVIIQEGTGGPAWVFYNNSVAGRTPQFHTGAHFNPGIVNIPKPSVIIWNHGHNIIAINGAQVASYGGRFSGPIDQVRLQWPAVPHMFILQNPWRTSTGMTNYIAEMQELCALYGDIPTANVHQAYLDFVPPKDPSLYAGGGTDTVHPSEAGVLSCWMPVINAMWAANYPQPNGSPAFLGSKAPSLLTNTFLDQWTAGVPNGWTKIGDGALTRDAAIRDGDDAYSVKMINGTASTLLQQVINAVPYRGQVLTLSVRQYIASGGSTAVGQIKLQTDGTGTPQCTQSSTVGTVGWRWMVNTLNAVVPDNATTITVELSAAGDALAGTVHYGRCCLTTGPEPRDAA